VQLGLSRARLPLGEMYPSLAAGGLLCEAVRRLGGFRMRLTLAVCCVVAWGGVAYAEGKHFDVRGVGATSCGKYAEMYRMNPRNADDLYISWAQGYISGVNSGMDAYFDLGSKTSDEMLRFLRKYCNDHPSANFHEAAEGLLKSLPRIKRKEHTPAPR